MEEKIFKLVARFFLLYFAVWALIGLVALSTLAGIIWLIVSQYN